MGDLELVCLAADSLAKANTPEPFSTRPLWNKPGFKLPDYIEHVGQALVRAGHPESEAIQLAIGAVKRWAAGGGHVDANTRAAASQALSEWEKLKSQAHTKLSNVAETQHSDLDSLMLLLSGTDADGDNDGDTEPDEDDANDQMQAAGVSMNAMGLASFGSVHLGHVRPAPRAKGYRGVHPTGRKTGVTATRAKAALALLSLHHRIKAER